MVGNGKIWYGLGLDNSSLKADAEKSKNILQGISDKAVEEGKKIDNTFKNISRTIGIVFSTGVLASFTKQIAETRGEFQQLEVAFTTMLGSKQKADALMARTVDFAAKTPFDLQGVANGTKQLLAYGSASETVTDELGMLGNIASGLSIPLNDMVYLYGTTRTQGRLFTMDLRQFMGRGIPLAEELAKQFKVTKEEVAGLVTAGKVGFEDVEKALRSMTAEGGKFYNLMEEQSKTITGKMSNLGDAMDQMYNKIGIANQDIISGALDGTIELVENYEEVGKIIAELIAAYGVYKAVLISTAVVQRISSKLAIQQALAKTTLTTAEKLGTIATLSWQKAQKALNFTMLANPYVAVALAVTALAYATYKYVTYMSDVEKAQQKVNDNFKEADKAIGREEMALNDLVGQLKATEKGTEEYAKIKDKIILQYGDYLTDLEKEKLALGEIEVAYDGIISKIREKYYQETLNKSISEANANYVDTQVEMLNSIKEKFIDKYGDKKGRELFFEIVPKLKSGEKLSKEYSDIIKSFEKSTTVRSTDGLYSSTVYKNEVQNYINEIGEAKNVYDEAKKLAEDTAKMLYAENVKKDAPVEDKEEMRKVSEVLTDIKNTENELFALRSKKGFLKKDKEDIQAQEDKLKLLKEELSLLTGKTEKKTSSVTPQEVNEINFAKTIQSNKYERERMIKDLAFEARKAQIEASKTGIEQTLALNQLNYEVEIDQLERFKEERLLKIQEQERAIWEAKNPKWKEKKMKQTSITTDLDEGEKIKIGQLVTNAKTKLDTSNQKAYTDELNAYADYIKAYIDKKKEFEENLKALKDKGYSDEVIAQTDVLQKESLAGLDEEMQVKEAIIIAMAEELVGLGMEQILSQLTIAREKLKGELGNSEVNRKQVVILSAKIKALEKLLSNKTEIDQKAIKDKDWTKTVSALKDIQDATMEAIAGFNGMSDSTKNIISSVFTVASSGISMISNIKLLSDTTQTAVQGTATVTSEAIKGVERASVILAIISAAIQIAQKIISLISGSKDAKKEKEIKRLQVQVDNLKIAYDKLGKSIEKAYATDATKLIEEQEKNLLQQRALLYQQINKERGKKKSDDDKIKEYQNQIREINDLLAESTDKKLEAIIGEDIKSAIDEFADAYMSAWEAGEDKAKAMNEVVKDIVKSAVKQFISARMSGEVERFYEYLAKAMEDGMLSVAEKNVLDQLENAITQKLSDLNSTLDDYVIDETDTTREATAKGFATMSQDSADELNGRFTVIQGHTFAIAEAMATMRNLGEKQLEYLASINVNTSKLLKIESDISVMKSGIDDMNTLGIKLR